MRDIFFKAKRLDNGEWVEGFYVLCRGHHYILPVYDIDHGFDERYAEWIEIASTTVCQYIGLMDKANQKIFENDIIEFDDTGEDGYEYKEGFDFRNRAVLVWNNGRFELEKLMSNNSGVLDAMNNCHEDFWDILKDCQIIGNIIDNPGMLISQN